MAQAKATPTPPPPEPAPSPAWQRWLRDAVFFGGVAEIGLEGAQIAFKSVHVPAGVQGIVSGAVAGLAFVISALANYIGSSARRK